MTPGRTPLRDQLGLNDPDSAIAAENKRAEKVSSRVRLICMLPMQQILYCWRLWDWLEHCCLAPPELCQAL